MYIIIPQCDSQSHSPKGILYIGQKGPNLEQRCVEEVCMRFQNNNRNNTFDDFSTSYGII